MTADGAAAPGPRRWAWVAAGGLVDAQQTKDYNNQAKVDWAHRDPLGVTEASGGVAAYDPLGNRVANVPPNVPEQPHPAPPLGMGGGGGVVGLGGSNAGNFSTGCRMDGAPASCDSVFRAIAAGQAGSVYVGGGGAAGAITVGGYIWVPNPDYGTVDLDHNTVTIRDGGGVFVPGTGNSELPQSLLPFFNDPPPRPPDKLHPENDCEYLAKTVEEYAKGKWTDTTFVRALSKRFVTPTNQDSPEMREFRAEGFQDKFKDDQGSYNQVRHFVGGFANAYYGGVAAFAAASAVYLASGGRNQTIIPAAYGVALGKALSTAQSREGKDEPGDRNLNEVSVPLGVSLAFGYTNREDIAKHIRKNVCVTPKQ